MPYKDRDKQRAYNIAQHKARYAADPVTHRRKVVERKRAIVAWVKEQKQKCEYCSETDPVCLEFHHIDPKQKDINLANAANRGWGKKRLLEEIAKCEVVCSNCHRKLHWSAGIA